MAKAGVEEERRLRYELRCGRCGGREAGRLGKYPTDEDVRRLIKRLCADCEGRGRRIVRRALREQRPGSVRTTYQLRCLCCGALNHFDSLDPDERELRLAVGSAHQGGLAHCRHC